MSEETRIPLTTKKAILERIEEVRKMSKLEVPAEEIREEVQWIHDCIMAMDEIIKPNTIVYLKNQLQSNLGKYMKASLTDENHFMHFFKQAYPERARTKAFTIAMADMSKLKEQQILDTLKVINTYCFRNKLSKEEKQDILPMIERIIDTQNVRYINQVKSMEGIRKAFRMRIVQENNRFKMSNQI